MSVKQMTTKQIRDDLAVVALTWPDFIPWEQADRVNALKAELKRRGESFDKPVDPGVNVDANKPVTEAATDDLETELRALSDRIARDPKNESAQQRFADIRYELRRRAKSEPPPRPSLPPRELELPPDSEVKEMTKAVAVTPNVEAAVRAAVENQRSPFATGVTESAPTTKVAENGSAANLVTRVGEQLLTNALKALTDTRNYSDAVMLVHAFVELRASLRDKPSPL